MFVFGFMLIQYLLTSVDMFVQKLLASIDKLQYKLTNNFNIPKLDEMPIFMPYRPKKLCGSLIFFESATIWRGHFFLSVYPIVRA